MAEEKTTSFRAHILRAFQSPVRTERVTLRHITRNSDQALADYLNADDYSFAANQSWPRPTKPYTGYGARWSFEWINKHLRKKKNTVDIGITLNGEDKIIGHLTAWQDSQNRPRLAYFTLPSYRHQGLTSEAYDGATTRIFNKAAKNVTYAETYPDNVDSQKFLLQKGFSITGKVATDAIGHEGAILLTFERPAL